MTTISERTGVIRLALAAVLGSVLLVGCGDGASSTGSMTATVTAPAPPPVSVAATVPPAETPESEPAPTTRTSFDNGMFVVGTDIQPGTYSSAGPINPSLGLCSYIRLKDTSGDLAKDSIGGGSSPGPAVVTIKDSDAAFQSVNCKTWTKTG